MKLKFPEDMTQHHDAQGVRWDCPSDGVIDIGDRDHTPFLQAGFIIVSAPVVSNEPAPTTYAPVNEDNQAITQAGNPVVEEPVVEPVIVEPVVSNEPVVEPVVVADATALVEPVVETEQKSSESSEEQTNAN